MIKPIRPRPPTVASPLPYQQASKLPPCRTYSEWLISAPYLRNRGLLLLGLPTLCVVVGTVLSVAYCTHGTLVTVELRYGNTKLGITTFSVESWIAAIQSSDVSPKSA